MTLCPRLHLRVVAIVKGAFESLSTKFSNVTSDFCNSVFGSVISDYMYFLPGYAYTIIIGCRKV